MNSLSSKSTLILYLFKEFKLIALISFFMTTLAVSLQMYLPVSLKDFLDNIDTYSGLFPWELCLYLAVFFISNLMWRCSGLFGVQTIIEVYQRMVLDLSAFIVSQNVSYFDARFSGAVAKRITSLSGSVIYLFESSLWKVSPIILSFGFSVIIFFQVWWVLSFFFVCWFLFYVAAMFYCSRHIRKLAAVTDTLDSKMVGFIVDCLSNHKMVHSYARQDYEKNIIFNASDAYKNADLKQWRFVELIRHFSDCMVFILLSFSFISLLYLYQSSLITQGSIVMCVMVIITFLHTINNLTHSLHFFFHHLGVLDEGLKDLIVPYELTEGSASDSFSEVSVSIKNLSFSFGSNHVFKNFNLEISKGQKVGIVGRSGSGKSTLVHLLKRYRDPDSGSISLNDIPLSSLKYSSLHSAITLISQENQLFNRSLRDNILYGKLDASEEELQQACELAHVSSFVDLFEDGLESVVGERGLKLSGGQKQRINIARAVLSQSPLLILDEATSALDSESEEVIVSAFDSLLVGKTVIAIAHRLSTLKSMDRIIVLDRGSIVEDGSHSELLSQKGLYADLWNKQSQGFI